MEDERIATAVAQRLAILEATIERGLSTFIEVGNALVEIRDERLYHEQGFRTFEDYCRQRWGWGRNYANKQIAAARVIQNLGTTVPKSVTERQARELASLSAEQQREVAATIDFTKATAKDIHLAVEESNKPESKPAPERESDFITLAQWKSMSDAKQEAAFAIRREDGHFNEQDGENIGWAHWSWNPITGCLHNCTYCYARDIAERFYPQKFEPTLHPARLGIPYHAPVPKQEATNYRNVFTCSMADLFGKWVPNEWIEAVLKVIEENPQWNFLLLTKFPQRLCEFEFPDNAWLGTSADTQARLKNAQKAMKQVHAKVRWLSLEPMLERMYVDWSYFDWVVMGGASRSSQTPEWRPPWSWICSLTNDAWQNGVAVYHKSNLFPERLQDYPGAIADEPSLPKEFGLVQLK
jgi:protein gp37